MGLISDFYTREPWLEQPDYWEPEPEGYDPDYDVKRGYWTFCLVCTKPLSLCDCPGGLKKAFRRELFTDGQPNKRNIYKTLRSAGNFGINGFRPHPNGHGLEPPVGQPLVINSSAILRHIENLFLPGDLIFFSFIHHEKDAKGKSICVEDFVYEYSAIFKAESRIIEHITEKQKRGLNAYVCMNPVDETRRRTKEHIVSVRTLYVEMDYNGKEILQEISKSVDADEVPRPSAVLESSPGKFQVIWKAEGFNKDSQEALLKKLQERFKTDGACVDCNRVLRLPGTFNLKPQYDRPMVVIHDDFGLSNPSRYKPEDFQIHESHSKTPQVDDRPYTAKRFQGVSKGDGTFVFQAIPPDPGFKALFDELGWQPLIDRFNKMEDDRFHDLTLEPGEFHYCPMPEHGDGNRGPDVPYSQKPFSVVPKQPELVHCFGCDYTGDMVKAVKEFAAGAEGGSIKYETMYDCARAICKDYGLNFEEFFPKETSQTYSEAQTPSAIPLRELRDKIGLLLLSGPGARKENNLPMAGKEAANLASELIYEDLKKRGKFYNANGLGYYLLNDQEDFPLKISPSESSFLMLLERLYGLQPSRNETNLVGQYLGHHAMAEGEEVEVSISFHFNRDTQTAYYAEQPGTLLKVTKDGISKIRNGQEGVLFVYPETYQPWALQGQPQIDHSLLARAESSLYQALFKDLQFDTTTLTDEQKCTLLTVYLILLFLPGLNKTKVILQTLGPSGAGKTTLLEFIGRILLGPDFSPQPLPEDPTAFENQLVNSSFIAYDNVDKISGKIKSLLCQAATGLTVKRRELFTTSRQVEMPSLATVSMSCITPQLTEIEHSNRSLVLTFKPREDYISLVDLLAELDKSRNDVMTDIVYRVQKVLAALDAQKGFVPRVKVRLADMATFMLRVARHEGWETQANELLESWLDEQMDSSMEDDDVSQAIVYALRKPDFKPTWLSASDFKNLLTNVAANNRLSMGWWATREAKTLSTKLRRNGAIYKRRFGLQIDQDPHTKNHTFRLNPLLNYWQGSEKQRRRAVIAVNKCPFLPFSIFSIWDECISTTHSDGVLYHHTLLYFPPMEKVPLFTAFTADGRRVHLNEIQTGSIE